MSYLLTQIVLCLLAVAILGLALGWFFGASLGKGRRDALEGQYAQQLEDAERRLEDARVLTRRHETALVEARSALEDKEGAFVQLRDRFRAAQDELDNLKARLAGNGFETESLKSRLREATAQLEVEREMRERDRDRATASDRVSQAFDERLAKSATELERMRQRIKELEREADELRALNQRQAADLELRNRELERLARRVAEARQRPMATPTVSAHLRAAADAEARAGKIAADTGALGEPDRTGGVPAPAMSGDAKDDLTRIKGIGSVLETTLNRLGYKTFQDIASLTPDEIAALSGQLGAFAGRIERDGWVDQARKLAEGGSAS